MHGEDFSMPKYTCALPVGGHVVEIFILVINKFGKISTLRCRSGCRWRVHVSLLRRKPLDIV
jgi:hypothetical protein